MEVTIFPLETTPLALEECLMPGGQFIKAPGIPLKLKYPKKARDHLLIVN
jgi:hypothetical protein